jgi:8-oxo-dGTP pyrophosphatase MutT (NUDIX family)
MEPVLRATARVLPVSAAGECLLLLDQDPGRPGELRWGTIGGALDPGEDHVTAALRELREETGVVATAEELVGPFHRDHRHFTYDGRAYLGDSTFFALHLSRDVTITFEHLEPGEVDNVVEARWWRPHDLAADGRLVAPDLPEIMSAAIVAARGAAPA